MKTKAILLVLSVLLFTACTSPATVPPSQLQTEVAAAIAATNASHSPTPAATNTPAATSTPRPANTPRPTPMPRYGSIKDPFLSIGSILVTTPNLNGPDYKALIIFIVDEVIRGEEANSAVRRAGKHNVEAPAGMEYALIHVIVRLTSGILRFDVGNLAVVSNGQVFDFWSSFVADFPVGYPEIEANLIIPGDFTDGWTALPVFIDDAHPLLAVGLGYLKTIENGTFFSLTP